MYLRSKIRVWIPIFTALNFFFTSHHINAEMTKVLQTDVDYFKPFETLGPMYRVELQKGTRFGVMNRVRMIGREFIISSVAQEKMDQEQAVQYCDTLGGSLPSVGDFKDLARKMTHEERYDPDLLPGMFENWFWSSTVHPNHESSAYFFNGTLGHAYYVFGRTEKGLVRCIKQF